MEDDLILMIISKKVAKMLETKCKIECQVYKRYSWDNNVLAKLMSSINLNEESEKALVKLNDL